MLFHEREARAMYPHVRRYQWLIRIMAFSLAAFIVALIATLIGWFASTATAADSEALGRASNAFVVFVFAFVIGLGVLFVRWVWSVLTWLGRRF